MRHTITNALNRELTMRMQQRYAEEPGLEDSPIVEPTAPHPDSMQQSTPQVNSSSDHLVQLHNDMVQAHRKMRNLSSELTRRKLTDSQLKDLGVAEDWLYVTKSIAKQYGEALMHMEHLLNELQEKVGAYRDQFGKDPEFLGE
jgi:chemotaxis protein histidine kinase CheA